MKKTILFCLIFMLLAAQFFLGPFFGVAMTKAESVEKWYVVKLNKAEDEKYLRRVALAFEKRFSFSDRKNFKNIYSIRSGLGLLEIQSRLYGHIEYAHADAELNVEDISVSSLTVTNDPGYTANPADIDKQWALPKTGFLDAWEITRGSSGNVVAIVDTGIDFTHEDLKASNSVKGFDFIGRQNIEAYTNSDDNGHGTLIAGILAATPQNGLGIAGTNWQVSVMPIKALDKEGRGKSSDIAEAIVWASDHGANIINLSLGGIGFGHDTTLANAIAYAFGKNVVIIAAAGNDSADNGLNLDQNPLYPICDDNNLNMVIGVTALDASDRKPSFANFGKNCIDVAAPGKRILSTINRDPVTGNASPNSYAYASGTSLAAPFVAGQAALIRTLYPLATNEQIRDRIIATTEPVYGDNFPDCQGISCRALVGSGRINVERSLETEIPVQYLKEGELVKSDISPLVYLISGGQKRIISSFVMNQRFLGKSVRTVNQALLNASPDGSYALPEENTLVKREGENTVYIILRGKKLPVTYSVFVQQNLDFAKVNTVSFVELDSWPIGNFLSPTEGTLLRTAKNKTVYWVVNGVLHPINYNFYLDRGLNVFPVMYVSDSDIPGFAKGEAFIK